jgi:hypothetical protein
VHYSKNGQNYKNFDKKLHDEFDAVGKQFVIDLFQKKNYIAAVNDVKADGSIDYQATDLAVLKDGKVLFLVEIEFKRKWNVNDGVNVLNRKVKHAYKNQICFYFYLKTSLDEFCIVSGEKVRQAQDNGFTGQNTGLYMHTVTTAMVGVSETMARIGYEHVMHYKKVGDNFVNVRTGKLF